MALPADPYILFSVLNTCLRDRYPSLDALCADTGEDKAALLEALGAAGFSYDTNTHQFR